MNCKACGSWIIEKLEQWVAGVCHNCGAHDPLGVEDAKAAAAKAEAELAEKGEAVAEAVEPAKSDEKDESAASDASSESPADSSAKESAA